ncbi:hypothetical protein MOD31_18480 [Paenarthrobacter sp. TYUT067]|uniref:hypothetical protein n=1 Tax=Paenarthrobacter sp. TYUT067 TaxID=2926245 RepID=UPI00202DE0ED|nr:hypothetical protein [Paenarthrobacter sp. TYUT067]MCM0618015.1 hypothetical protein [Paenarthrobacter sp. TYUT067]
MTIDSVISGALARSDSSLGNGVLTGVIVAGVLSLPRLIRRFIRGVITAPERMMMGALNIIDRRTSSRKQGLL